MKNCKLQIVVYVWLHNCTNEMGKKGVFGKSSKSFVSIIASYHYTIFQQNDL